MIELILTICALTFTSPYYDCSEEWDIIVYDDSIDGLKCGDNTPNSLGCSTYDRIFKNNMIELVHNHAEITGKHTPKLKHESILWHELLHLTCECGWHDYWDKKGDGRSHRYNQQPDVPETVIQYLKPEWRYK